MWCRAARALGPRLVLAGGGLRVSGAARLGSQFTIHFVELMPSEALCSIVEVVVSRVVSDEVQNVMGVLGGSAPPAPTREQ